MTIAIAACLSELNDTATEIQLTPAGSFEAQDGRPGNGLKWKIDSIIAAKLIESVNQKAGDLPIDYEHQIINAAKNGQEAPAAGWFKNLEWREGVGLFATGVKWTDKAASMIAAKEYRYISPVFTFDRVTGAITKILMAGLVNTPALDGMQALTALANEFLTAKEGRNMEDIFERLRYMLNLPLTTTPEEMVIELDKLKAMITSPDNAAALSLIDFIKSKDTEIAALTADKSSKDAEITALKDSSMSATTSLSEQVAALSAQIATIATEKREGVIQAALSDARLLPGEVDFAKGLDDAQLSAYLATKQPIAALSATQTGGKAPIITTEPQLTDAEIAVCKSLGITHEAFLKTKGDKQ